MPTTTEPNPDHFDHDQHVKLLDDASTELYRHGDRGAEVARHQAMAGACGRAAAIHRQLISRVAHARQAQSKLERLLAKIEQIGPMNSAGDLHAELQAAGRDVRRTITLLRDYAAQPQAPWITPTPVLFPLPADPEDT